MIRLVELFVVDFLDRSAYVLRRYCIDREELLADYELHRIDPSFAEEIGAIDVSPEVFVELLVPSATRGLW